MFITRGEIIKANDEINAERADHQTERDERITRNDDVCATDLKYET